MAYRAEIEIALKGVRALQGFRKELQSTANEVDRVNAALNKFAKSNPFTASGGRRLLTTGASSTLFGGQSSSVEGRIKRLLAIKKDELTLEKALLGLQEKSRGLDAESVKENNRLLNLKADEVAKNNEIIRQERVKQSILRKRQRLEAAGRTPGGGRRGRRGGQRFTDIATGAGFPLLFGGGPLQALAGGLGGAVGGLGGAIAGSAIVAQLEGFARAAAETGVALTSTSGALELVREKSLFSTEAAKERAAQLEELGQVEELATLLTDELVQKFGNSGVAALTDLGNTTKETTTLWNQLTTQLQILISGPLNSFLKLVNNAIGGINEALKPTAKQDFVAIRDRILKSGDTAAIAQVRAIEAGVRGTTTKNVRGGAFGGGTQTVEGVLTEAGAATGLEQLKAAGLLPKVPVTLEDKRTITSSGAENLAKRTQRQNAAAANRLAISKAELAIAKESSELSRIDLQFDLKRTELQQKYTNLISRALSDQEKETLGKAQKLDLELLSVERNEAISGHMRDQFESAMQLNNELLQILPQATELSDEFKSLANTINNEIVNGIEGMIQGTKTLGQVASSMLKKIASQMLQTAIMGPQGSDGIAGTIFKALGIGVKGGISGFAPAMKTSGTNFFGGGFSPMNFFANGGRPPVGRPSVVGERGPELFIPRSSGTVVPNHALGGGANVTVNVDASGSSVEGSSDQAGQLGKAIGIAVQQELIKQKRPGGLLTV